MTYVTECLRLLYWIYFKPFTLERWLQKIHPELKPNTNPFSLKGEFRGNSRLRRYAGQVWWLTAVTPVLAVLLVAPTYTLFSGDSFNWFRSGQVLLGWLIGLTVARGDNKRLEKWFYWFLIVAGGVFLIWNASSRFAPETMRSLLQAFPFITNLLSTFAQFLLRRLMAI